MTYSLHEIRRALVLFTFACNFWHTKKSQKATLALNSECAIWSRNWVISTTELAVQAVCERIGNSNLSIVGLDSSSITSGNFTATSEVMCRMPYQKKTGKKTCRKICGQSNFCDREINFPLTFMAIDCGQYKKYWNRLSCGQTRSVRRIEWTATGNGINSARTAATHRMEREAADNSKIN